MDVRKIQLLFSMMLFGAGAMLCALTALASTGQHPPDHGLSGESTGKNITAAETESGYELAIRPDPQANVKGILLVKLKKLTPSTPGHQVGEVMVWWTTPAGHRSSFPIRPLADNVWASRLVLEPEAGKNRVNVVILGKSGDGGLGETIELLYEFEMPRMNLKFIAQKGMEKEKNGDTAKVALHQAKGNESAEVISTVRTKKKAPASVPAIVILVVFANAIFFIPGLFLLRIYRRLSSLAFDFRLAGAAKAGATLNPVFIPILAESGLIDRETGHPLPLEEMTFCEAADKMVANPKDFYEATVLDPPPGGSENKGDSLLKTCSPESIKEMSDQDLYELVGIITDEMEKNGVSDDLKKLIRVAEQELANRQSKTDQGGEDRDRQGKESESRARNEEDKLNLKELKF